MNFIGLILVIVVIVFLTKTLRKFSSAWNDMSSAQNSSEEEFMREILNRSPQPVRQAEPAKTAPAVPEPRFMERGMAESAPDVEAVYEPPKTPQAPPEAPAQIEDPAPTPPAPVPELRVEAPPAPPPPLQPLDPTTPIAPTTPIGDMTPLSSSSPTIEDWETVGSVETKLYIAGVLAEGSGEAVGVPQTTERASLVRLRNDKTMLIVPDSASDSWIESQMGHYDYICRPGKQQTRIVRRLEDFLADHMFR